MRRHYVNARQTIILVGRRKGAVAAAARLGLSPVVIDVAARQEQTPSAYGGTVNWALNEVRSLSRPVAVTAVATGSVMAAAAIREHFSLPGISTEVARCCHDKLIMKKAITAAGIPCAPWMETTESTTETNLIATLGLPLVLKMPISSGGRGVWICHSLEEVTRHLQPGLLAEGFVTGTEMSVESFRSENTTLLINHTCYLKPRWANVLPANLTAPQAVSVNAMAERIYETLGISSGISHMEIFLTDNGPVFGEIAARPPGGHIMTLIRQAYGIDPWEILLRLACGETPSLPSSAKFHAGVWMIHPGKGEIVSVSGLKEIRSLPNITKAMIRLTPGDLITERLGCGESKGEIFACSEDFESCAKALKQAIKLLKVELK